SFRALTTSPAVPSCRAQRCRIHGTATVLDQPLEGVPPQAEAALHAIDEDEGRKGAEWAFGPFVATCEVKDPRAVDCLAKDRGALLVYDDFPHRRTSLLNIDVASVVARFSRIDRSIVCTGPEDASGPPARTPARTGRGIASRPTSP